MRSPTHHRSCPIWKPLDYSSQLGNALSVAAMEVVPPGPKVEAVATTPTTAILEPRVKKRPNHATQSMLIVERLIEGWSVASVATTQGVTAKTVHKWRDRYAAEGAAGLADRTSRPHHSPNRLTDEIENEIEQLRRQRLKAAFAGSRKGGARMRAGRGSACRARVHISLSTKRASLT